MNSLASNILPLPHVVNLSWTHKNHNQGSCQLTVFSKVIVTADNSYLTRS